MKLSNSVFPSPILGLGSCLCSLFLKGRLLTHRLPWDDACVLEKKGMGDWMSIWVSQLLNSPCWLLFFILSLEGWCSSGFCLTKTLVGPVSAKSFRSCPILCDPMDCSPPGSSVRGILQVRILEWIAMPSSRGSSQPRDRICVSYVSCIDRQVLYY